MESTAITGMGERSIPGCTVSSAPKSGAGTGSYAGSNASNSGSVGDPAGIDIGQAGSYCPLRPCPTASGRVGRGGATYSTNSSTGFFAAHAIPRSSVR
jgi:hypothetical protein